MAEPHYRDPTLMQDFLRRQRMAYTGKKLWTGHNGHSPIPLSQMDVAHRAELSRTVIGERERGIRRVPVSDLDRYAWAYGLRPALRDWLWRLRTGQYPPEGPAAPDPEARAGWSAYVAAMPFPAIGLDPAWRVTESNSHWHELFTGAGQRPPANLLEWILFAPYARQLCGQWRTGWIQPLIQDIRVELEHHPVPEVYSLCTRLRADRELAPLWNAEPRSYPARHLDGQLRLLRPPLERRRPVRLLVANPSHDPTRRILSLVPEGTALESVASSARWTDEDQAGRRLDAA